jgi:hypothetical protein
MGYNSLAEDMLSMFKSLVSNPRIKKKEKHINSVFRLGSHPQDFFYVYANIPKSKKV